MAKRLLLTLVCLSLCAGIGFAQGLDTTATKNDWEEINFEFDSDILSDGYPSLLRLAELLQQNADYRVTLRGHTDFRGPDQYNVGLGRRRAETPSAGRVCKIAECGRRQRSHRTRHPRVPRRG